MKEMKLSAGKMKPVSIFFVLLVVIPPVLNRALPQETADSSDTGTKSSTEKEVDVETTTVIPDLPGGGDSDGVSSPSSSTEDTSSSSPTEDNASSSSSSSSTEETLPSTRKPSRQKPHIHHHFDDDYDMFLDHLNRTSQFKLELFDRTLMEVEKELRPGTPLMMVVDWILNLVTQLQNNNNNRRQKPSNGQTR